MSASACIRLDRTRYYIAECFHELLAAHQGKGGTSDWPKRSQTPACFDITSVNGLRPQELLPPPQQRHVLHTITSHLFVMVKPGPPLSSTSSRDDVLQFLKESTRSTAIISYRELFGWSQKDYDKAFKIVSDLLDKHYPAGNKRFPKPGQHDGDGRVQIERTMHNEHAELFNRRQDMQPDARPSWYFDEIYLTGRGMEHSEDMVDEFGQTAGMLFQSLVNSKARKADSINVKREESLTLAAKLGHFGTTSPSRNKRERERSSSVGSAISISRPVKSLRIGSNTPRYSANHEEEDGDIVLEDAPPRSLSDGIVHVGFLYLTTSKTNPKLRLQHSWRNAAAMFDSNGKLSDWQSFLDYMEIPDSSGTGPKRRVFTFLPGQTKPVGTPFCAIGVADMVERAWSVARSAHVTIFTGQHDYFIMAVPEHLRQLSTHMSNSTETLVRDYKQPTSIPKEYRTTKALDSGSSDDDDDMADPPESSQDEDENRSRAGRGARFKITKIPTPPRPQTPDAPATPPVSKQSADSSAPPPRQGRQPREAQPRPHQGSEEKYPRMILPDPEATSRANTAVADTTSVIDYSQYPWVEAVINDFFSTKQPKKDITPTPDEIEKEKEKEVEGYDLAIGTDNGAFVDKYLSTTHHDPATFVRYCKFWQVDPNVSEPNVRVWFDGWKKKFALRAYQMHATAWALQRLLEGARVTILAIDMGMGKTAMALAMISIHQRWQRTHGSCHPSPGPIKNSAAEDFTPLPSPPRQLDANVLHPHIKTLAQGAVCVIVPPNLTAQWVRQVRQFVDMETVRIVLDSEPKTANDKKALADCWHISTRVPQKMWPTETKAWEEHGYTDDELERWKVDGMPMQSWLRPSRSSLRPAPWQLNVIFLLSPYRAESRISSAYTPKDCEKWFDKLDQSYSKKKSDAPTDFLVHWSFVVVDESHEKKSSTALPWPSVAKFLGAPQVVALSATPIEKLSDLHGMFAAAYEQFVVYTDAKDASRDSKMRRRQFVFMMSSAEYSECVNQEQTVPKYWEIDKHSLTMLQQNFLTEHSYGRVAHSAKTIDAILAKVATDKEDDPYATKEVTDHIKRFGQWFHYAQIKLPAELIWSPLEGVAGVPAVQIPPNTHYDEFYTLDSEEDEILGCAWDTSMQKLVERAEDMAYNDKHPRARREVRHQSRIVELEQFLVYEFCPRLFNLREGDDELDTELGSFSLKTTTKLYPQPGADETLQATALYQVMSEIDKGRGMQLHVAAINTIRDGSKNVYHKTRKIVVAAHKPFNALLMYAYLLWLAHEQDERANWSADDLVFCASWFSPKEKQDIIQDFKGGDLKVGEYKDTPSILIACGSTIASGLSLVPSADLRMLDVSFQPSKDKQILGRVQRSADDQKEPQTRTWRSIPRSSKTNFTERMAARQSNKSKVLGLVDSMIGAKMAQSKGDE